jgi:WD40 repeat protein
VHFWRLASGRDSEMTGYPFKPRAIAWDAHGSMLATGGAADVTVWGFGGKGPEGTSPIQLEAHQGVVTQLAFAPRKATLASGAQDMGVILWEPKKQTKPVAFGFLDDQVTGLAWRPDQRALTGVDAGGNVVTWSVS